MIQKKNKSSRKSPGMNKKATMKHIDETQQISLSIGIKDMPDYDPDMELQGLTLTVPTWITVIERAKRRTDFTLATRGAKEDLRSALTKLEKEVEVTLEEIE